MIIINTQYLLSARNYSKSFIFINSVSICKKLMRQIHLLLPFVRSIHAQEVCLQSQLCQSKIATASCFHKRMSYNATLYTFKFNFLLYLQEFSSFWRSRPEHGTCVLYSPYLKSKPMVQITLWIG